MNYSTAKLSFLIFLPLFILIAPLKSTAQQWVEMMMSPNANFYSIQSAFNEEWEGKSYVKGKGWKQFKRWENFWESRILEDGSFPTQSKVWNSYKRLLTKSLNKSGGIGNWQPLGPFNYISTDSWSPGTGRVNCIAEDPNNSNIIYIGAPAGGIWKTVDAGVTWTPLGDEFSTIGISGITIDPSNSNIIYLCTGDTDGGDTYSIGILKSTDGGASWTSIGNINANQTTEIIIDPNNSSILYLCCSSGVLKSTDAGNSWTTILNGNIRDIDMKPGSNSTVYAVSSEEFYVSTNGGASWNTTTNGLPNSSGRLCIATTPANSSYVYVLSANTANGFQGLYLSTDSGNSFNATNTSTDIFESTQAWYDMAIAVSPTDENTIITGVLNLWRSTNGGTSFTKLNSWSNPSSTAYTHADIHFLKYFGNRFYCGSDGGIYKSTNNGNSFNDLSFGLQIGQFYRIDVSQNDVNTIAGGLQDNGGYALKNGNWKVYYGADGMEAGVDPNNSNIIFGMIQYGDLYVSTNGANTSTGLGSPQTGRWVTPMQMDKNNDRLVAGYDDLYEYDYSSGWNQLSTFNFPQQIRCVEIFDSNSDIIFVSTNDNLYRTTDNGSSFTDITGSIPTTSNFSSIEVNPTNSNELWVTRAGWSAANHVYHTIDGGNTWNNITANLPNLPCNIIKHDAGTNGGVFVGTDIGVYYYDNSLGSWIQFMNNLPNVIVNDLEINESTGVIRAGTYGRGIWESPNSINLPDYDAGISLIIEPQSSICGGTTISPIVRLNNYGALDLNNVAILYDIDGIGTLTYNWTGNISTGASVDITLPALSPSSGPHVFNAQTNSPNGQPDQDNTNDASSSNFTITSGTGTTISLNLITDCWGSETTWSITDSSGLTIVAGGPYSDDSNGDSISQTFCLADGCYDFIINDSYGDGIFGSQWGSCSIDGNYTITDDQNVVLVQMSTPDFGNQATHNFCLSSNINADFSANVTSACSPETINFQDLSTGLVNSWNWVFPGGNPSSSTAQNPSVTYANPGSYDVELTVSNGTSAASKIISGYIVIDASPTVSVNPTDPIVCLGDQVQLIASGAQDFLWNTGDTSFSLVVQPLGDTSFSITGNNGNCYSQSVTVNISVIPASSALADVDINNPLIGQTISFSSLGSVGTSFLWNFDDGNSSSSLNPSHQYNSSGVYFATLEVGNSACSDVDTVEINVGLNDISELAASNLAIYPNPNNGLFTINFNELDYSQAKIEIINSIGQTIYVLNKVELVNQINMKENAKGIYFIKVAIDKEVFYKKINLH